ncbi:hypothetical protein J4E93_008802 [Alternaria ventricosa]|uniref:uncharacterized protein n=1 Tax=Alternaria ventricosa TaxID=1187951 RepID=UPI0020C42CE1|nr:uncharacterized protein J4E93_008802 [Alternaria ventricosa]KAI4640003.1 hypothetical protein J4E93_008802 [Alternaria ventricosa]
MRTVTIALLCFLLLVALDIGRVVASSGFFPLAVRRLHIAVSYLYWEVFWEVYYQFTHNFEGVPLYLRLIALLICIHLTFCLYVYIKYTYWIGPHPEADQDGLHEPAEKGQSQETKLPVTPIVAHTTPPPVTLPPAEPAPTEPAPTKPAPPLYPPPFELPFTNFRGTGESFAHSDRRDPTHYPVLQLSTSWGNTRRKERDYWRSAPRQPPPAYRSTEHENVAAAPTIPKPEVAQITTKSTTTTTKDYAVIAPAHKVVELPPIYIPTPTQTPSTLPSAPSIDPQLGTLRDVENKKHLVVAEMKSFLSTIGTDAGCEAPAAQILALMVAAKMHLMPFFPRGLSGLDPSFLIWKDAIVEFWCRFRPYGWEIREDEDGRLRTFLQQYRDTAIWLGLEHHLDDLTVIVKPAQPPASSTQDPPAPKMGTLSAIPTTTEHLPAPAIPIAPQPQKAPSTPAPIQQAPLQQPIVAQGATGLIDFSKEAWFGLPDDQLKALSWRSFSWPDDAAASFKIWSHDVPELASLPVSHPEFIMASYVKAELEKMAPIFKRAAIVLRIQGRGCKWPDRYDLMMVPLLGHVSDFLFKAAEMTKKCQEVVDWDSRDAWYKACFYFHKRVLQENIWEFLGHRYDVDDANRTPPLKKLWEELAPTWLPDITKG